MTGEIETFQTEEFEVRIHADPRQRKCDLDTIDEVQRRDVYRLRQLAVNNGHVRTIVDIGAHIGTFTMLAGRLFPAAWVWSFEPNLEYFPALMLNAPENCSPINLAVLGYCRSSVGRELYPSNTDDQKWRRRVGGAIEVETLLSMCAPIDILKIDVEQSEVEILRELEELERVAEIPHIIGEWHFQTAKDEVRRILSPTHNVVIMDGGDWNQFYAHRK